MAAPAPASASVRVDKATSDLLNGPDWTMNMDICDSINSDQWQVKDVFKALKKRLQNKNPRVQFLALTLLEAMIKNCGDFVHQQVVEREVLQEMVKIIRKKTDMQVRDKILVLLDSWQEAFGGPGGKYPQYYWAYADLKRSGVVFPPRSADSALIFSGPSTPPIQRHPPAGYGMPGSSSASLDEAMASGMGNLSLSDMDSIRSVMELLSEMLRAVNPKDSEAVKDEIIADLVNQCRSNQKRLLHLVNSTGDEQLLGEGLTLNDSIQSLLAKHDAIASGSPLPADPLESVPETATPVATDPVLDTHSQDEVNDNDDEFAQLSRRKKSPSTVQAVPSEADEETEAAPAADSESQPLSVTSNALVLPDPPAPVRTTNKEQEMIDLLTLTLTTTSETPHTPTTPPSASHQDGSPPSVFPNGDQGFNPYNSYIAPWAQPMSPQAQPLPQPSLSTHPRPPWAEPPVPPPLAQPQAPGQFSSSYPLPPWTSPSGSNSSPYSPTSYQFPSSNTASHAQFPSSAAANTTAALAQFPSSAAATVHPQIQVSSMPMNSTPPSRDNRLVPVGDPLVSANQRPANPAASKPYIPSYRLFEDLIELRNPDGSLKVSGSSSSGLSARPDMIGGRK